MEENKKKFDWKIVAIVVLLLMMFSTLTGCSNIKYNAKLYDDAVEWVNEDFISNNLVEHSQDGSNPFDRTFIIKNHEEYDQIFAEGIEELAVDFNKQMVVVYTFSTIYHRDNSLVSLDVEESVLKITYSMKKEFGIGDASMPYQRWFVVVLDKLDINSVVFEEK